ncbi:MAG: Stp1/IreP family PP2C-type Ser/Thr phosphatase [Gammaproteobacteria bacterium]|nr:Stp1/IreP family PP2C-type Ser/Thr phosphatase [Gammaproteobacteria bacterium]MCI0590861.1 Stp1/IreP family PP2C-type Ser/Thr phosphatase [Gammaproteobacteria bacterium]
MDLTSKLEIANISHVGKKRRHNEDSTVSDPSLGLLVLADGMGGYRAGEVASSIAVTSIMNAVKGQVGNLRPNRRSGPAGSHPESLLIKDAISQANWNIYKIARDEPQCQGMGTTVVVSLFYNDEITIAHVGDSRLYRLRGGKLQQLTTDHSLIQELIDRGMFTPEEAEVSMPKNLVTRALGVRADVQVDIQKGHVSPGDIYLLCSDGLNDMVTDEEIRLTLSKYSANLVQAAGELVQQANEKGGNDNISVILARPLDHFPAPSSLYQRVFGLFS